MMDNRDMGFEANRRKLLQGAFAGLSFLGLGVSAAHADQGVAWVGGLPSVAQGRSELRQLQAVRLPERL